MQNSDTDYRGQIVQGQSVHSQGIYRPHWVSGKGAQLQPAVNGVEILGFKERENKKKIKTPLPTHRPTHTFIQCLFPLCIHLLLLTSQSSRGRSMMILRAHGTCQSWACLCTLQWTRADLWCESAPVFGPVGWHHKAFINTFYILISLSDWE